MAMGMPINMSENRMATKCILILISLANFLGKSEEIQRTFPDDFKFGAATASYQVEGGWNASDKGENIWDRFTHEHPSLIKDGTNGDIACDSYHKFADDVAALKKLGVHFYRFSLSWSRILPGGFANRISSSGAAYYNALINSLLENGIEPMVTLYHWDLPQVLQELGGWTNEILALHFVDYADVAFKLFGDRVRTWITFNEPDEICVSAYGDGGDAPAYKQSGIADYLCGKTLLLAHAKAYKLYNLIYKEKQKGRVGITINSIWAEPKTSSPADVQAAERFMLMDFGWWAHPILSKAGDYPDILKKRVAKLSRLEGFQKSRLPQFTSAEINLMRGTFDFLGVNHYSTLLVSDHEYPVNASVCRQKDLGVKLEQDPSWEPSSLNWLKVVPWGFRKLLTYVKNEYGNPLVFVTENGFADLGGLNDSGRINYHNLYLRALLEAMKTDGCNVKAYTIWSLIDNMEWREGYTAKFGLYEVNFKDPERKRTSKASAKFYASVIKNNGFI